MNQINVKRTGVMLKPDSSRVLVRPFNLPDQRSTNLCARVMSLPEQEVNVLLEQVMTDFGGRHQQIRALLLKRYEEVKRFLLTDNYLTDERRLLIGAYFTHEYALEAAALFNPSIVPHPNQADLPKGALRFIMSLRATGEGHISSITFRTGVIDKKLNIEMSEPTRFLTLPEHIPNAEYEKPLFGRKLHELNLINNFSHRVLEDLQDRFTFEELERAVNRYVERLRSIEPDVENTGRGIVMLARSNYEVRFPPESRVSERVLFPSSPSQSNGIEDARFVLLKDTDGTEKYYAPYTAYDGKLILPQMLETSDFLHFEFSTLNGPAVQNKGMALFPRRLSDYYAMISRQDNENIFIMFSDNLHFWYSAERIMKPTFAWEFVQLGNCGSPIETDAGWLVLSHGVGAMRKYCIGAFLLDRDDPRKLIGRLREPLLTPNDDEREGYVPNVVYSCGALVHQKHLILPYAMSDYATNFATVPLQEIIDAMD